ncbi:RanGTP-binding protein-domain-containing protein [Staphylotrichum tortipilum]|uniref:RanGTP-binding protein-domain-containing protein n=1 Tax=Staphylotrichum tortipilum TaxID=2831512 RepID=A0AAN6ML01_9PEZI|nr:RanGTP-binding protein-domain-containing protein [Staphylotrichum longicolle]
MDALLQTLGVQTFNFAVRSGIALTSRYAVQQCSRLLKSINDKAVRAELRALQKLLDSKIKILSPALDLIEFRSGRGNVFLESAVPLAKSLHRDIVRLGKRLEHAAADEEAAHAVGPKGRPTPLSEAHHAELLLIIKDIKDLLGRIDRDIPLLQLAITASGEKMSSTMTPGISPSRMMQASALLSFADAHFVVDPSRPIQVGPSFTLSLYMLFLGHSHTRTSNRSGVFLPPPADSRSHHAPGELPYGIGEGDRKPIWQEVMHKVRVRLCRIPAHRDRDPPQHYQPQDRQHESHRPDALYNNTAVEVIGSSNEYLYHLELFEDLDDGRVHDQDDPKAQPHDRVSVAGIRESIPIHQISKIFYTDTGRILGIGNDDLSDNNPVLLLKRDPNAKSPLKLREEWLADPEAGDGDDSESYLAEGGSGSDDQDDIDRQLWEETEHSTDSPGSQTGSRRTCLPPHLDPEWLALEVYVEDDYGEEEGEDDDDDDEGIDGGSDNHAPIPALPCRLEPPSVDAELVGQLQGVSIKADSSPRSLVNSSPPSRSKHHEQHLVQPTESYITRAPFGTIASSLSLLEMLIRLTSLQEFQQTPHLAIPDHILMFFLEETSTTGLQGEAHWRMRSEAKRRMGFDPYTDAVPRQGGE